MFWSLIFSLVGALAGLAVYLYYLGKGQFEDHEDVKYQLFRDE